MLDSFYIDLDSDGDLKMNGLFTDEPIIGCDAQEELNSPEIHGALVLPENCEFDMEVERREQEWEGADDHQYQTTGSFQDLAKKLAPKDKKDSATWAVNLHVPGKPGEMEFLILA